MGQPVKLSDALVLDARIAGEAQERSIAGQVEFWAKLGQAVEPLLSSKQTIELRRTGEVKPLSELLASVDTAKGRERTKAYLKGRPYPHYRQFPGRARVYIRTAADGTETVGRFVNRAFVASDGGLESAGFSEPVRAGTELDATPESRSEANAALARRPKGRTA
jgi:hypothetical protein